MKYLSRQNIYKYYGSHKQIMDNFSYITILQLFTIVAPLITYPYLVRVLGKELYGIVLSAQMLVSYVSLVVDFGSNNVCAKHVSIHRDDKDKLSEILSSVLCARFLLWIVSFAVYYVVITIIPSYRDYLLLFVISYFLSIQDVLFPQFFFQGIEQMKFTTYITIGIRLFFIILVFPVVTNKSDYILVPVLYSIGYMLGGIVSLYIIVTKLGVHFQIPKFEKMLFYIKDSSAIFATELITTIKDKLNYLFVGTFAGMSNVVIYDLGLKLNGLIIKPISILMVVLFPRMAKTRNVNNLFKSLYIAVPLVTLLVVLINIFLPWIVRFFIGTDNIDLLPLRLFSISPIFLSVSILLANNYFVAFGHNKYVLYSIIITTSAYLVALSTLFFTGHINTIYAFVSISLISYAVELIYRIYIFLKMNKRSMITK